MAHTTSCTYHCGACDCHFHSLDAFDSHRTGDYASNDPDTGRRCVHPFDMDGRLAALTEHGECRMYADVKRDVTVWTGARALGRIRAFRARTALSPTSQGVS